MLKQSLPYTLSHCLSVTDIDFNTFHCLFIWPSLSSSINVQDAPTPTPPKKVLQENISKLSWSLYLTELSSVYLSILNMTSLRPHLDHNVAYSDDLTLILFCKLDYLLHPPPLWGSANMLLTLRKELLRTKDLIQTENCTKVDAKIISCVARLPLLMIQPDAARLMMLVATHTMHFCSWLWLPWRCQCAWSTEAVRR